jgi:hypothetical protein
MQGNIAVQHTKDLAVFDPAGRSFGMGKQGISMKRSIKRSSERGSEQGDTVCW